MSKVCKNAHGRVSALSKYRENLVTFARAVLKLRQFEQSAQILRKTYFESFESDLFIVVKK